MSDLLQRIVSAATRLSELGEAKTEQERARHVRLAELLERAIEIKTRPKREPWIPAEAVCPACGSSVSVKKNGELFRHDLTHGKDCRYDRRPDRPTYEDWLKEQEERRRHRRQQELGDAKERVADLVSRISHVKTDAARAKLETMLYLARSRVDVLEEKS